MESKHDLSLYKTGIRLTTMVRMRYEDGSKQEITAGELDASFKGKPTIWREGFFQILSKDGFTRHVKIKYILI